VQQLLKDDEEGHKVACVAGEHALCAVTAQVFSRGAHCRRNNFASRVHEQLGEPFEDLLDNLRVGLLEVCDGEGDADVCYTSCNFSVGL
jgi:hypothetical protein